MKNHHYSKIQLNVGNMVMVNLGFELVAIIIVANSVDLLGLGIEPQVLT